MHIVHHKDTFDDLGAAVANGDDDDLAVLGVLIEVMTSQFICLILIQIDII